MLCGTWRRRREGSVCAASWVEGIKVKGGGGGGGGGEIGPTGHLLRISLVAALDLVRAVRSSGKRRRARWLHEPPPERPVAREPAPKRSMMSRWTLGAAAPAWRQARGSWREP